MATSIFDDKSVQPNPGSLREVLGKNAALWESLKSHLEENYGECHLEWKFYNQKSGWLLKVLIKKRNLFFLTPFQEYFRMTFVFGDKAIAAVEASDLPISIKQTLRDAKKYMEGRGLSLDVRSDQGLEYVTKLVEIKINN
ncbi:MAG: DUF3788 domain-containing protein [bacterium]